MSGLYYLNIAVHVLSAIVWLGGMFFIALIGAPVFRQMEPGPLRTEVFRLLGARFRTVGWVAIVLLLVTGSFNLGFRGLLTWDVLGAADFWTSRYGVTLAWKLGAVSFMLVASTLHDFVLGPAASRLEPGSTEARRVRRRASWLARLNAFAGVVVVLAAIRLARGG